jgi:hypothetical protein
VHVEVHVLHLFGGHVQLFITEAHHAALRHLQLSFADFFGIAAVGHAHVARESQFHGQVGMLCLVAAQSQLLDAAFGDVVGAAADAIFGIVAFGCQLFDFVAVQRHHLSHAHVAQGDTHGAEQILRADAVCIPFHDFIFRHAQFILLAVGELSLLVAEAGLQFAFGLHTVDGLVVEHTAVVLKESPVLTGDVHQHG